MNEICSERGFFIAKFSIVKKENSKFDFTFSKIFAEWLIKMAKMKLGYSLGQPKLLLSSWELWPCGAWNKLTQGHDGCFLYSNFRGLHMSAHVSHKSRHSYFRLWGRKNCGKVCLDFPLPPPNMGWKYFLEWWKFS